MTTTPAAWPCLRPREGGCTLDIAVTPNARRTGTDGLHDGALRLKLVAPPVDGKANQRLCVWLAEELQCPRRSVRLARGATARRKQVEVDLSLDRVSAWLDRQLGRTAD